MDSIKVELTEYSFVGPYSNKIYHPAVENGIWTLITPVYPYSFDEIVRMCNIPREDAIFLKLKYGG